MKFYIQHIKLKKHYNMKITYIYNIHFYLYIIRFIYILNIYKFVLLRKQNYVLTTCV